METSSRSNRIGIVNSSTFGIHFPDLMERLNEHAPVERVKVSADVGGDELARRLGGFRYVIASVTPEFPASFFRNQSEVVLIARHGIGCDNVDLEAATREGVLVTRVEGIHERDAVAELNLSLILCCLRHLRAAGRAVQSRNWERRREFVGGELSRQTVGVVGCGNIGSRVVELVVGGFGAEVLVCEPSREQPELRSRSVEVVDLPELLRRSDVISLNASLNETSRAMIGSSEFSRMKDGVVIVNTARGELIDEEAFVDALEAGTVSAAGLDVVSREPIPDDHPLLGRDNVLILPHIGGYTRHSLREMDAKNVRDVERVMAGEVPGQLVNPSVLRRENRAGVRS